MDAKTNGAEGAKKKFSLPKNIIPKIVCILIAVAMWAYVMYAESPNYKGDVKGVTVDLYGISKLESTYGLSAIIGSDQSIDVVLTGKKNLISSLSADDVYAYVDLSSVTEAGSYSFDVHVNAPSGVTVQNYSPDKISVYLDEQVTVRVPVKTIKSNVSLASGLSLGTVTTNVDYVEVTGPAQFVSTVSAAQLSLDLGNIQTSKTYTGELELTDENGAGITNVFTKIQPSSVTAFIPVIITKDVALSVDFIRGYFNSENSSVSIMPSVITVSMPVEMSSSVSKIVLTSIDETHISGNTTLQSSINLPSGVSSADAAETARIAIVLKNVETAAFTLPKSAIVLENVPEGYTAEVKTASVVFGARGPAGSVSQMSVSDFVAVADLSGHSVEGTSSVALSITSDAEGVYALNTVNEYPTPTVMVSLKKS